MAMCNGCSSSIDDKLPILPPTSSEGSSDSDLSSIEEEGSSTESLTSSKYVTEFSGSSSSSSSEVSSYKNLFDGYSTPTDRDAYGHDCDSDCSQDTIGVLNSTRVENIGSKEVRQENRELQLNQSSIENQGNQSMVNGSIHTNSDYNGNNERDSNDDTIVDVSQEVPLDLVLDEITDSLRRRSQNGDRSGPQDMPYAAQNTAMEHLFDSILIVIGINRSRTMAFLLMSFSLLAANASHLKLLIESPSRSFHFYAKIALIIISSILQILAKITACMCGDHFHYFTRRLRRVKLLHYLTVKFCMLVVATNVTLTAFNFADLFMTFD